MARVFKPKKTNSWVKVVAFIVVVAVVIVIVLWSIGNLGKTNDERQLDIARDAIIRASVQCYALESQFPPSLDYLAENYGITLDTDKFIYHYRPIASNMLPEIKVFVNVPRGN